MPTETYSAINFSQPSQEGLSPSQLLTTLENIFSTLMTGAITDPTLRDEGLCLLEGYYSPFSQATLQSLYPTHAAYASQFSTAAQADLAAGFLTRYDYNQAVKAAQAARFRDGGSRAQAMMPRPASSGAASRSSPSVRHPSAPGYASGPPSV